MAAGLATGRTGKMALMAGIAAVAGIKWMLRRNATGCASPLESSLSIQIEVPGGTQKTEAADCCFGEEKGQEPDLCDAARAVAVAPPTDSFVVDEEVPVIWEQGWSEPVSCGAVGAQTVWFEMEEPMEAIPAVPALAEVNKLPESFFCEAPNVRLDQLPKVPAIVEGIGCAMAAASDNMASSGEVGGLPAFDLQPFPEVSSGVSGQHQGPNHSAVPQASVVAGRAGHLVLLVTAVVLVMVAIAVVLGAFQQDGWVQGLKRHWQAAGGSGQESPVNDRGEWATPLPPEK